MMNAGASAIAQKLAAQREAEAEAIAAEIVQLRASRAMAAGKVSAAEHISRLNAIRESLEAEDDEERTTARLKVAQGFRSVIDRIDCRDDGVSIVKFVGGRRVISVKAGRGVPLHAFGTLTSYIGEGTMRPTMSEKHVICSGFVRAYP
ncbi:hypothetical protein P0F65_05030 [Sphingomonas sp. I4]